jgi:hypothetical protein
MPRAVESTVFGRWPSISTGPITGYVVPAGFVAVVKCISIVWGDVTASGLDAWVQAEDLTKFSRYTWAATLSLISNFGGVQVSWGSWVMNETEELQAQCNAGACDIQASGFLLAA